jgi:putative CocE/NonD family hydrolase
MWGISYPGFYVSAGMIDAHPALKAVSPQAPVTDLWNDSFHVGGAFNLMNALMFTMNYGPPAPGLPARDHALYVDLTENSYEYLLDLGPLSYVDWLYFRGRRPFWNEFDAHPNDDEYWRARDLLPHLENTAPAVMTVGGWFDDRNLHGSLACYRAVEEKNPGVSNFLVMGPWEHAGWVGRYETTDGIGDISFGSNTAEYFQENIELAFFEYFLKDRGKNAWPEAIVFETGSNAWRTFDDWPPEAAVREKLYLEEKGRLSFSTSTGNATAFDEFVSDPENPVPAVNNPATWLPPSFLVEDQRFLAGRGDILVYETDPLEADVTLAGPIEANLWVSTSRGDADWVVKVIDVFPAEGDGQFPNRKVLRDYRMLVRAGVLRGRFRESADSPRRFVANEPTRLTVAIQDVCHTFRKGHRIMVHVHSSWFPYIDRNPQAYVENIFRASQDDFVTATHRVYRSPGRESYLEVFVWKRAGR